MARTLELAKLVSQPESYRDEEWERAFFEALPEAKLKIDGEEPKVGPDGWPYLFVRTSNDATEPAHKVIDWLSTRGLGMVVNAHKSLPDYVFTYGMIWNFRARGEFVTEAEPVHTGEVKFEKGQKLLAGPPSKEYLPDYVRKVLADFFGQQGVKDPRILVLSTDKKHFDLCVSLESLGSPKKEEHQGIAEAVSWFLPHHYSIVLASENGLPQFHSLRP